MPEQAAEPTPATFTQSYDQQYGQQYGQQYAQPSEPTPLVQAPAAQQSYDESAVMTPASVNESSATQPLQNYTYEQSGLQGAPAEAPTQAYAQDYTQNYAQQDGNTQSAPNFTQSYQQPYAASYEQPTQGYAPAAQYDAAMPTTALPPQQPQQPQQTMPQQPVQQPTQQPEYGQYAPQGYQQPQQTAPASAPAPDASLSGMPSMPSMPTPAGGFANAEVPLNLPDYHVSFIGAIKRYFQNYVTFSGRASRKEYWFAFLFTAIVGVVAAIVLPANSGISFAVNFILGLAFFLPNLSIAVRRLHDSNKSGWFILLVWLLGLISGVLGLTTMLGGFTLVFVYGLPYEMLYTFAILSLIIGLSSAITWLALMCAKPKPEGARFDK